MNQLNRTVAAMMARFGTDASITVAGATEYDVETSQNVVSYRDYPVRAMFFDYIRKTEGEGEENNTLIKSGDKQVYVQPPQQAGQDPLPHLQANKDFITVQGTQYKIITVKQINPSLAVNDCILFELYIRQ